MIDAENAQELRTENAPKNVKIAIYFFVMIVGYLDFFFFCKNVFNYFFYFHLLLLLPSRQNVSI